MSRSEKAEQTYQQILSVSAKLFREQGYEKTSIQDILTGLKMSKGAVYHHFKSKKEILDAILEEDANQRLGLLRKLIKEIEAQNARDKLTKVFLEFFDAKYFTQLNSEVMGAYFEDPHLVLADFREQMSDAKILVELFEEGRKDGSIETEYPLELAEITLVLLNTWLNPLLHKRDYNQTLTRVKFLQDSLNKLGANILSDEVVQKMMVTLNEMITID